MRKWLLLLVSCAVASIAILAVFGKWQVGRIYESASYANAHTVPRLVALEEARTHFTRWRMTLFREAMGGPGEAGESNREHAALREALDRYKSLIDGKEEAQRRLERVHELLAGYERTAQSSVERRGAGQRESALGILIEQSAVSDRIVEVLDSQIAASVAQGRDEDARAVLIYRQASWMTLFFVLSVILVLLVVGRIIARRIDIHAERLRALSRESEIFRVLVESVRDQSVMVHDMDDGHRIVYANSAACQHFGVGLETLLTWSPVNFDPHVSPEMLKRLKADWRDQGHCLFESEHRIATGELIPVEVASNFFEHEGHRLVVCVIRDLRSRHEKEALMLEMERAATEYEAMQRMARFAQSAPGFMYTMEMRPDGKLGMTYASTSVEDIWGVSVNEALADTAQFDALIWPEDLEHVRAATETSSRDLSPLHKEWRISHPSKGLRWLETHALPELEDDGTVTWYGYMHDITDRKKGERYFEEVRARLLCVLRAMPDLVWLKDEDGVYLACNHAFEQFFGAREIDIVGRTDYDFVDAELADFFRQKDREAMEAGHIRINEEWVTLAEDGRRVLLETRKMSVLDDHGNLIGVLGIGRDVTERKQMEDVLAQREREFRALAENAPDNICRYDRESRVVYMNPELERTLGVSLADVAGKRPVDNFPQSESMLRYQAVLEQVLGTGTSAEFEMVSNPFGDGRALYDLIRMAPEFDEHGQVAGVVAIGRDYTEQKRLELELSRREQEFRALSENSPDMIIRYDLDCRRIYVNQAFFEATGATAEEVLGKPVSAIAWWSVNCSAEQFEHHLREVIRSEKPVSVQLFGYVPATNQARHTMVRIVPEFDGAGCVISLIAVVRDVTDLVQLQMDIAGRERQFRTLLENTPDVIIRYDRDFRRTWVSSNYEQVYGNPVAIALGKKPSETWGKPLMRPAEYEERLARVMETGIAEDIELDWYDEQGEYVCHSLRVVPEFDATGQVDSVLTIGRDVSEIKRAAMRAILREQEFRTLVEHSPDTICRYDRTGRRIYANPKMVADSGIPLEQLLGKTPGEFPGGECAQAYEQRIAQVVASGEATDFELPWSNVEGKQFCSHVRLTPEFDREGGRVTGVLAVGRDITEIDEYRKRVHRMAFYDALTNLPNRSLLNDRIGQTIADAAYHGHRFGLMILDLDGFKAVNDTLGHGVGDLLLHEVGKRLLGCVRIYDTVARLGGDEFAVLVPEVREDGNLAVVARKILEALAEPFNIGGKELFVSASIGIALYPSDNAEIDGLFRYADSAMYHAKKQGRNNFQFYSKELTARSGERMALESALRRARKKKELALYYQPQVDITSGRLIGAEALLRWDRGAHGMVAPDCFIPIAEETGLIVGIGEWVLETACETAVAWNRERKAPLKVAVNLSTRQFVRNDLVRSVRSILETTGCKPEWLGLEITESLLLGDTEDIRRALAEFDAMGLNIAIDDFGTGYSALGYLNRFPVSVLKIDRSFVSDITTDRDKAELVKAIVSMSRSLRKELVAEGVETDAQVAYLGNLGCHVAQGYLFGRAVPRKEFEALMDKDSRGENQWLPQPEENGNR